MAGGHNTSTSQDATNPGDVVAKLNYYYNDGGRPWLYARQRTSKDKHSEDYGGSPELLDLPIRNGRFHDLRLDQHAFQLVQQQTLLSNQDFVKNPNYVIEQTYYPEIERLIQQVTGAARVVCIHHQTRNGKRGYGGQVSETQYATDVHTDTSPASAETTFFETLQEAKLGSEYEKGRFLYINAWRSIDDVHPIQDNHLAVCDETSLIKPDDYILYDYYGPDDYAGAHYYLSSRNADRHRWYYFPEMVKNEVLLFKQFDSDPTLAGRMCFHSAITTNSTTTIPRQSIEVRCVAFFPHHRPNTCPSSDGPVRVAVGQLLLQVQYINEWPRMQRWWFKDLVQRGKFETLLHDLVFKDTNNDLGLKGVKRETKEQVCAYAMKQGFVATAQKAVEQLK